jgi:hypothetical protein
MTRGATRAIDARRLPSSRLRPVRGVVRGAPWFNCGK